MLGVALLVCGACSESFLDEKPISEISAGNFWQRQEDAEAAIAGCYDALQNDSYYGFDMYVYGDVMSDNAFAGGDNPNMFALDGYTMLPTNETVSRTWRQIYFAIGRANTVISQVPAMDEALFEAGVQDGILGEAYFLRGLHYFNLGRIWGTVPIVTDEVSGVGNQLAVAKSESALVLAQAIEDFELAYTLLPDASMATGRVRKGTAAGFLAKAYLEIKDFERAITWAETTEAAGYRLLATYDHLFDQEHKNNVESIFEIQYTGDAEGNVFPELVLPTPEASFEFIKFNTPTPSSQAIFTDDDVRKASSFVVRNGTAYLFKWRNGQAFNSADHNVVLRYADILLVRAEALALSGSIDEAVVFLNQVRNRAGLPNYSGALTAEAVETTIMEERRLELAFEGHRWFDLKRKGFETLRNAVAVAKPTVILPHQTVLPIPQREIDNNSELKQNDGY